VYQKPSEGYCFIVGLPFGREWEDIVQGEKPACDEEWWICSWCYLEVRIYKRKWWEFWRPCSLGEVRRY
jgi:hypothetical protein